MIQTATGRRTAWSRPPVRIRAARCGATSPKASSNAFFDTELALFVPGRQPAPGVCVRIQPAERHRTHRGRVRCHARTRRTVFGRAAQIVDGRAVRHAHRIGRAGRGRSDGPLGCHRLRRRTPRRAIEAPATDVVSRRGIDVGRLRALLPAAESRRPGHHRRPCGSFGHAPQAPVIRSVHHRAAARLTIPVDSPGPELASTDVSGVVTSTQPIVVERAMYLTPAGQPFAAGHGSAGVTAPATRVVPRRRRDRLVLRSLRADREPERSQAAEVRGRSTCCPAAERSPSSTPSAPKSRFTIYVDDEQIPAGSGQRPLASTAVAMRVTSTNAVPDHRGAGDVVAPAGLVRGPQRRRHDGDRDTVGRCRRPDRRSRRTPRRIC